MGGIRWDGSLAMGVGVIDDQHKQLIQRLNDLAKAVEENQGPKAVASTLSFLTEYTHFHFQAEEGLMVAQEYPGLADHQKEHEEFRTILRSMGTDFETDGASAHLAGQINTFLFTWLVRHIRQVDTRFGKFLQDKGAELR